MDQIAIEQREEVKWVVQTRRSKQKTRNSDENIEWTKKFWNFISILQKINK